MVILYFNCPSCGKMIQTMNNCYDINQTTICDCGYIHITNLTIDSVPSEQEEPPEVAQRRIGSDGTYILGANELSTENIQDFIGMVEEEEEEKGDE